MKSPGSGIDLPALNFYEFTGIVIPGSVTLVGLGYLFDLGNLDVLLTPRDFGSLGVHLILAYVAGHLIQAVGNAIEAGYWRLWKGMPTDWPIVRAKYNDFPSARDTIYSLTNHEVPAGTQEEQLQQWRPLVGRVRSSIYASGRAARLEVFNGNYGMFRGLLAAVVVLGLIGWQSTLMGASVLYPVLVTLAVLAVYRMHRFGMHYAKELFANAAELAKKGSAAGSS